MPTALPIEGRPIRLAVVGLGQIAELMLPSYLCRDDVQVVAGCDRNPERIERWRPALAGALLTTELDELLQVDADIVDVLVPTHLHAEVAVAVLDAGFHVQLQKPIARSAEDCDRIVAAARRNGALLRILEDYVFFPPLVKLHEVVRSGEIGAAVGLHMKVVNTGRGGWDVLPTSLEWQFEQTRDGRGMLVFDHGWHQLAVATWLFGPIRRIFGWVGSTEIVPGLSLDAPATLVWEHEGGLRGVLDITLAVDTYFKSDFYSCDERVEVTTEQGSVRCNRISSFGRQEPSIEIYREGEIHSFHAITEGGDAGFAASAAHMVDLLRGRTTEPLMGGDMARGVLGALLRGLESSDRGTLLDVP